MLPLIRQVRIGNSIILAIYVARSVDFEGQDLIDRSSALNLELATLALRKCCRIRLNRTDLSPRVPAKAARESFIAIWIEYRRIRADRIDAAQEKSLQIR